MYVKRRESFDIIPITPNYFDKFMWQGKVCCGAGIGIYFISYLL